MAGKWASHGCLHQSVIACKSMWPVVSTWSVSGIGKGVAGAHRRDHSSSSGGSPWMACRAGWRAAKRSLARESGTTHQICRGAGTCAALSPARTKPQVSWPGQVDSRMAPPGESASSAHMVAFAAAPNWLFHARCGRPSGDWAPKTSACASFITSLLNSGSDRLRLRALARVVLPAAGRPFTRTTSRPGTASAASGSLMPACAWLPDVTMPAA
ncbi:MAG TPA: hypothetical protein VG142_08130 [Trebonia sp.]|nr:hypothetical protein [Trebonia sp.]